MTTTNETAERILAYVDSTAWQDQPGDAGDPEHRAELIAQLAEIAVGSDRELLALVVREACQRGRGAALRKVCDQHRREAELAAQGMAEGDGELTSIAPARWRRDHDES